MTIVNKNDHPITTKINSHDIDAIHCYASSTPSPIPSSLDEDEPSSLDGYEGGGGINEEEAGHQESSNDLSTSSLDELDAQGISLLREIFPDASCEELEELHFQRVETVTKINSFADVDVDVGGGLGSDNDFNGTYNMANEIRNKVTTSNDHNGRLDCESQTVSTKNTLNDNDSDLDNRDNFVRKSGDNMSSSSSSESNILNEIGSCSTTTTVPETSTKISPSLTSPLARRIMQQSSISKQGQNSEVKDRLSDDFLRIPSHQAFQVVNQDNGSTEWKIISNLEKSVIDATFSYKTISSPHAFSITTAVLNRDMYVGLGLQLREWKGSVYVNALICHDGKKVTTEDMYKIVLSKLDRSRGDRFTLGPAFNAGVKPGDRILGVNGKAFLRSDVSKVPIDKHKSELLANAAKTIAETKDPIALHIMRTQGENEYLNHIDRSTSSDMQQPEKMVESTEVDKKSWQTIDDRPGIMPRASQTKRIHPLARCLAKSGVIKAGNELKTSETFALYTNRALIWQSNSYLKDIIEEEESLLQNRRKDIHPGYKEMPSSEDLAIVRQALCIHIVNTFVDGDRLAFTIWVYDVESRSAWYAPVRYFQDFSDLRLAVSRLHKSVDKLPFPNVRWFHEPEASSSEIFKNARCNELELFLRGLCTLIYKDNLEHSCISEIALYIQTFLGCDAHIKSEIDDTMYDMYNHKEMQSQASRLLQRAVQLYTFRIFLLPAMDSLVAQFITGVKKSIMSFDRHKIVSKTSGFTEKEKIFSELSRIKHFYSSITKLIHDGCFKDFELIVANASYGSLIADKDGIFQEAVREQVEINCYVPLRSLVSRLLVFGWRHDDKEVYFKQQALQKKSQSFFKIKSEYQSPSLWKSIVDILTRDVGQSTLPCTKLRAVVNAGKEIGRLSKIEFPNADPLGADDFLPIFIYCVVRADIERPCALSVLLRSLCDENQLIGEIGYYLSSFEAAIAYIHELDLSSVN